MSYFKPYNPNPCGFRVGDCTVRAICKATGKPWEHIYCALAAYGLESKDLPSANHVWGKYLYDIGYRRHLIENMDSTVADFCQNHPSGTYILAIDGHVVCAQDGFFYDTWDSSREIPVYYWTKE